MERAAQETRSGYLRQLLKNPEVSFDDKRTANQRLGDPVRGHSNSTAAQSMAKTIELKKTSTVLLKVVIVAPSTGYKKKHTPLKSTLHT